MAADVPADLAARGLITLHRCAEPLGKGEVEDIPQEHYGSAVALGPHWEAPRAGSLSVRLLTTDAGRRASDDAQ
jgi:hypothetical protein